MGTTITWIAPYQFNQKLPFDVDYKVMSTFLEFYRALLKFINFKLYTDLGHKYPPEFLAAKQEQQRLYLEPAQVQDL